MRLAWSQALRKAMRRRDFIKGIVGSATARPLVARAQQGEHMRRIGVLMNIGADDPEAPALVGAFSQGLAEAGWIIGRNARIDYRWYQGNPEAARAYPARADAGYHPCLWHPRDDSTQATHAHGADRVCAGGRSGRSWHR